MPQKLFITAIEQPEEEFPPLSPVDSSKGARPKQITTSRGNEGNQ